MKRKKGTGRGLKRVLFASGGVLIVVLTAFTIKYINRLSDKAMYAYGNAGKADDAADAWREQPAEPTRALEQTDEQPVVTPLPPLTFDDGYVHSGEMKEVLAYENGVAYGLRYPVCEEEALQTAVQSAAEALLAEWLDTFGDTAGEAGTLRIDYEDGGFGALYSVLFRVEKEADGVTECKAVPWVYNKKKGEAVDAENLFADRAYVEIAEKVNEAVTKNDGTAEAGEAESVFVDRESFSAYLLTAEGIRFFYEKDSEESSVLMSYPELHTYMNVTVGGKVVAETIRELDPEKPMIALTFDDGPHYQNTPRLLELLEQYGVRVTFFVLGDRATWNGSPEALKLMAESGNEIASHTQSHKMLSQLSEEELVAEIAKARDVIYELTGDYPTFIRPPYGSYNDMVKKYACTPLIIWNLDSEDWKTKNKDSIIEQILGEAGDGKIVLCHDIHTCTVDAMEVVIPELIQRGYQIVTVRELLYYKGVELENGAVYHSSYN